MAEIGEGATVTEAEILAVADLPPLEALAAECRDPGAAARALDRYTTRAPELHCEVLSMLASSSFGTTLAVTVGSARFAVPAGLLLETMAAIALDLVETALRLDPRVEQRWFRVAGNHIGYVFQGTNHRIGGPITVGPRAEIHSLVFFDDRRILAIGNCAALSRSARSELIRSGSRQLERVRPGAKVVLPSGDDFTIRKDAQVLHAQITGGPILGGMLGLMLPTLSFEDLEWILYTERADRDDLWFFIRDLTTTPGVRGRQAWDLIDMWETWRTDKTFYRGAEVIDLMSFAPHAAVAEWLDAAEASSAELALHRLGLRPLRDWPCVDLRGSRGVEVGDFNTGQVLEILPWDVPVALDRTDPTAPVMHREILWRLRARREFDVAFQAAVRV